MKNYRHSMNEWKRAKKRTATRVKQVKLSTLRKKLDRVFSEWIRKRDAPHHGIARCYTCNRNAKLEASHFIPRQHLATRFNEFNVHGCCSYCNRWLHGNLAEYYIALIRDYGQSRVDDLMGLKRETVKFTRAELEAMIKRYSSFKYPTPSVLDADKS